MLFKLLTGRSDPHALAMRITHLAMKSTSRVSSALAAAVVHRTALPRSRGLGTSQPHDGLPFARPVRRSRY